MMTLPSKTPNNVDEPETIYVMMRNGAGGCNTLPGPMVRLEPCR